MTKEKLKLYFVIGLACVAAIVAYFQFLHVGSKAGEKNVTPPIEEVKFDVYEIKKIKPRKTKTDLPLDEVLKKDIRNVFVPARLPQALKYRIQVDNEQASAKAAKQSALQTGMLELKGTIIGGENPIAIINDQFVRTGEKIGDYQIIKIDPNEVLLRSDNHEKVLQVLTPADKK